MSVLTQTQRRILERLNTAGAATLTDLAVRLRTMPESIEADFNSLRERGLIETLTATSGLSAAAWYNSQIHRVSDKGREALRLTQLV